MTEGYQSDCNSRQIIIKSAIKFNLGAKITIKSSRPVSWTLGKCLKLQNQSLNNRSNKNICKNCVKHRVLDAVILLKRTARLTINQNDRKHISGVLILLRGSPTDYKPNQSVYFPLVIHHRESGPTVVPLLTSLTTELPDPITFTLFQHDEAARAIQE